MVGSREIPVRQTFRPLIAAPIEMSNKHFARIPFIFFSTASSKCGPHVIDSVLKAFAFHRCIAPRSHQTSFSNKFHLFIDVHY